MKNKEEIILKYLDNQLDDAEYQEFEKRIENEPLLIKEVEKYRSSLNDLKLIDSQVRNESDNIYFSTIIPSFNKKREKEKRFYIFKPSYIYSAIVVTALLLIFLSIPFYNKVSESDLSDDELSFEELFGYYENRVSNIDELTAVFINSDENLIDNYVLEEFQLNLDEINYHNYYLNGYWDLPDNNNELSDEIFNEMINIKLL